MKKLGIVLMASLMVSCVILPFFAGCGGGSGSSGGGGIWGGPYPANPTVSTVSNLTNPGEPLRSGDWCEVTGSNFFMQSSSSYVNFTFQDNTSAKASLYGTWTDTMITCRVPDGVKDVTFRGTATVTVVINGVTSNSVSTQTNPTPNPSPQPSPPVPSPSPSPTATVSPSPTPSPAPSPTTSPGPTPNPSPLPTYSSRDMVFSSEATNLVSGVTTGGMSQIYAHNPVSGGTYLISRTSSGAAANQSCVMPVITPDGRYVAFMSHATNLTSDSNPSDASQVFVYDRSTGTTVLASKSSGASGSAGNEDSSIPFITGDGRYVSFESFSTNLISESVTEGVSQVYLRDLTGQTTTLVSRASDIVGGSGSPGNMISNYSSVSSDGRYVCFQSMATNLVSGTSGFQYNVFVRDRQTGTTIMASRADGASGAQGNDMSMYPCISSDGRYAAFESYATNFVEGVPADYEQIYLRDLVNNTTTLVSRASDLIGAAGAIGDRNSFYPSISSDGTYIVFSSAATNLGGAKKPRADISQVYVRSLGNLTTTLVSRAAGASGSAGDKNSYFTTVSPEGRYIVFESEAANLGASNGLLNVFLRDTQESSTAVMSTATGGAAANADCFLRSMSRKEPAHRSRNKGAKKP
ncbi:MAG: hypothetical protein RDV48_27670 [Candidatus Eremiobacteraeota bacterium]|nr:hypothetical protein [Candidatus Eremiobacteraeota bacterium]